MAKTKHYFTKFEPGRLYHIYNRAIDRKPLFTAQRNYIFFLRKMDQFLTPFLEIYAWCLLSNHFHLMVRIKDKNDIITYLNNQDKNKKNASPQPEISIVVSDAFGSLFKSYALAFNKQEGRVGSLFQHPFKRSLVDNEKYFTSLIFYIHANPQKHGLIDDFKQYPWSSYGRILLDSKTKLMKNEVLNWFGGPLEYQRFHEFDHKIHNRDIDIED